MEHLCNLNQCALYHSVNDDNKPKYMFSSPVNSGTDDR